LDYFKTRLEALLADRLLGIYVIGSFALGDFNLQKSDIDFIVLIGGEVNDDLYTSLQALHADFTASELLWAKCVEAVYISPDAFDLTVPNSKLYPQLEAEFDGVMFRAPLEPGWVYQCQSLREHPLIVIGAHPRTMIQPIERTQMFPPAAAITGMWLDQAQNDPAWIPWLRPIKNHKFVVMTLCRMLYSMATGDVTSKAKAAKWAQANLPQRWHDLIDLTLANTVEGEISQSLIDETLAFIRYTFDRSQLQ